MSNVPQTFYFVVNLTLSLAAFEGAFALSELIVLKYLFSQTPGGTYFHSIHTIVRKMQIAMSTKWGDKVTLSLTNHLKSL